MNDDLNDLKSKRLCEHCIGEKYLKAEVQGQGQPGQCSYCDQSAQTYSIGDLADRVEVAFEQHFRRTSDQPDSWEQSLLSDRESHYDWERHGEPVVSAIANAADIPEDAAEDIQIILDYKYTDIDAARMGEETEFDEDSYYEEKRTTDHVWQEEWREFERSLKTEARFFSRTAAAHLGSIFNAIDQIATADGRPLVLAAGPQTTVSELFRARVFQSDERLIEAIRRPDVHLGPPPAALAIAGRLNARGISVFYGADHPGVAIAETRPPVGSQVAVARFEIVRPLRLLDLTALRAVKEVGSIFDTGWCARLERAAFLCSLGERLSKPVMPDDEAFEYLPTQAIADFLATENTPVLDGIVFPSVQATVTGLNVVLFHKAARVETLEIPEKTEIRASTGRMGDEGWEVDYSVIEEIPRTEQPTKTETDDQVFDPLAFARGAWRDHDADLREATLRIDPHSVKVHVVRGVAFQCETHEVRRHRWEQRAVKF
jgi:hypothetical protein